MSLGTANIRSNIGREIAITLCDEGEREPNGLHCPDKFYDVYCKNSPTNFEEFETIGRLFRSDLKKKKR